MRVLILMVLVLNIPPVNALTWKEVWHSLGESSYNIHPRIIRNKVVTCYKHIRYEEYISGNSHHRGYVRHHHEKYKIPCY